jgi:hypothetical protein
MNISPLTVGFAGSLLHLRTHLHQKTIATSREEIQSCEAIEDMRSLFLFIVTLGKRALFILDMKFECTLNVTVRGSDLGLEDREYLSPSDITNLRELANKRRFNLEPSLKVRIHEERGSL